MKKYFFFVTLFISLQSNLHAVFIGAGAHYPDGYYVLNTLNSYNADILTDSNGKIQTNDLDLTHTQLITQGFYYTGNFVYFITIPLEKKKIGLFNETKQGLGDSYLGVGYFIENSFMNILSVLQVKFPLGRFDKNAKNNIGTGAYSLHPELYLNKTFSSFMLDVSIEGAINFQENDANIKIGDRLNIESVLAYIYTPSIMFGPSFLYTHSKKQELQGKAIDGTNTQNIFMGVDLLYSVNEDVNFIANIMKDVKSKNSPKGIITNFVFIYAF